MKIGFFGKLPGYGDFIQRGVSAALIKHFDNWILQSIEASRGQVQADWQLRYFNSPIWRFVASRGLLSENAVTGIVMPSVDKAGRCYPFTVIIEVEDDINPFTLANKLCAYHDKAEEFILTLLEQQSPDLDGIHTVLNKQYSDAKKQSFKRALTLTPSSCMELGLFKGEDAKDLSHCQNNLLHNLLAVQNIRMSMWWTAGGVDISPQTRFFSGMPPVDSYLSFLIGAES